MCKRVVRKKKILRRKLWQKLWMVIWGGASWIDEHILDISLLMSSISWRSQKQPTVTMSSTEIELYSNIKHTLYISEFLKELSLRRLNIVICNDNNLNIVICNDNKGAQLLSKNYPRIKHRDIKFHSFILQKWLCKAKSWLYKLIIRLCRQIEYQTY